MSFNNFNLHPHVAAGARAAGYVEPTPIQEQAIPSVMSGLDVMGLAQTGTGKTAVYALPILHRLMSGKRRQVRALIIAPTRELAEQINEAINALGRQTGIRSISIYGGVGINQQMQKLKKGVEIVVACPGRLLDHIDRRTINLSGLEVLVIDEADQMFDMGFMPSIRQIIKRIPCKRQTLLFSATMPDEIKKLSRELLHDPVTVKVGKTAPPFMISHALYPVEQHLKTAMLLELLNRTETESVLVFTRTKNRAKRLGEQLVKAGYKTASLQGNLSQNKRQAAMEGFRDGTYQILVATDIAARGIDVKRISHVINYDISDTPEAYIHRIGRTGRAEKSGDAFTLVTRDDTATVRAIEKILGSPLRRNTIDGFNYKMPAPRKDAEYARTPAYAPRNRRAGRTRSSRSSAY